MDDTSGFLCGFEEPENPEKSGGQPASGQKGGPTLSDASAFCRLSAEPGNDAA
ncbi:MAG: hypothetical protein IJH59_02165 [Firmicutes bacterium]|nr:hypothetical protein [Bacillota bacterium]